MHFAKGLLAMAGWGIPAGRSAAMKYLTEEQQKVLCVILLLLLTGLIVKTWRTAHPPDAIADQTADAGK